MRKSALMSSGAQGIGSNQHEVRVPSEPAPPTLSEMAVGKSLADRARKSAAIPEREFDRLF